VIIVITALMISSVLRKSLALCGAKYVNGYYEAGILRAICGRFFRPFQTFVDNVRQSV
jgi:hypothetical protein